MSTYVTTSLVDVYLVVGRIIHTPTTVRKANSKLQVFFGEHTYGNKFNPRTKTGRVYR